MRLAILSDIHANLEALCAVLADLDALRPDAVYSLGDNVGYGPDPEACVELIRSRGIVSVMGNHEHGLISEHNRLWFNPTARQAIDITAGLVSAETLAWAASLPRDLVLDRAGPCRLVHGFPPSNLHLYLYALMDKGLRRGFAACDEPLIFLGHTHMLEQVGLKDEVITRRPLWRGVTLLEAGTRHMVNVGSVGQPRDDYNSEAKYVLFDPGAMTVEVRFVPYDAQVTARKIIRAGIPRVYAERLL